MKVKIDSFATPLDASIAASVPMQFTTGGAPGSGGAVNLNVGGISNPGYGDILAPFLLPYNVMTEVISFPMTFTGGKNLIIAMQMSMNGITGYSFELDAGGGLTKTEVWPYGSDYWLFIGSVGPTVAGPQTVKLSIKEVGDPSDTIIYYVRLFVVEI